MRTFNGEEMTMVVFSFGFLATMFVMLSVVAVRVIWERASATWTKHHHKRFLKDLAKHPEKYPEIQKERERKRKLRDARRFLLSGFKTTRDTFW